MTPGPIWFDLENTPHVLFLEPLIRRLEAGGRSTLITAKPQSQTIELAEAHALPVMVVGDGNVKGRVRKLMNGLGRAAQLVAWARKSRPALLVSSSRSASVAARWAGIPAVGLLDYEHAEYRPFVHGCVVVMLPDLLQEAILPRELSRVADFFPGLKENLYIDDLRLDRDTERLARDIAPETYTVVARPPAMSAHYAQRVELSIGLWLDLITYLHDEWNATVHVLPRDAEQHARLSRRLAPLGRVRVLERVLEGPALIAAADLVVSAGGTMNREAAVLGVPAWSVFTGPTPFIDECLAAEGRLRWVRNEAELHAAWSSGPPPLLERRGPYPGGLQAVLDSVHLALEAPAHASFRLTRKRQQLTSRVIR